MKLTKVFGLFLFSGLGMFVFVTIQPFIMQEEYDPLLVKANLGAGLGFLGLLWGVGSTVMLICLVKKLNEKGILQKDELANMEI